MAQLMVLLWQAMVGPEKGNCETCMRPGTRQTSIVDPLSPALKIYCKKHHDEYQEYVKTPYLPQLCAVCDAIPTTNMMSVRFRDRHGNRTDLAFCNTHSKDHETFILNTYGISKPYW